MVKDLVLIPGALATSDFWHYQEQYLHARIRIHHAPIFSSYSITDMAEEMINHLPEKFTLLGFSLGGYIALELMRHIPDRIDKLILINSGARAISTQGQLERDRSLDLINKGKFDFLINLIFKNSIHHSHQQYELLTILKRMAREVGAQRYAQQLTAILNKPDHTELLASIQCPTLLMVSRDDKVMPPERSEHMATYIENSQLIYIENCGHVAPLEQPGQVNKILSNWL